MSVRTQTLRGKSYGSKLFHPFVSQLTRVLSLEHRQTPLVQTSAVKTNATRQIAWKENSNRQENNLKNKSYNKNHWKKSRHDLKDEEKKFVMQLIVCSMTLSLFIHALD